MVKIALFILSLIFLAARCPCPNHDPTICDSTNIIDTFVFDTVFREEIIYDTIITHKTIFDTIRIENVIYDTSYVNLDTCLCVNDDAPLEGATATSIWEGDDWWFLHNVGGIYENGLVTIPPAYIRPGETGVIRSPGTKSCHYYYPGNLMGDFDRAEIHSDYPIMNQVYVDSIMYLGWSDYFVHVTIGGYMGVLQLRTADRNVLEGCPDISLTIGRYSEGITNLGLVNGIMVNILDGKKEVGAVIRDLKEGVWYDFVIGVKFSKGDDGYFKIWAGEAGTLDYENPTYSYNGNTVFNLQQIQAGWNCGMTYDRCHTPQLRWGIYQWKPPRTLFESYKGPVRINLSEEGKTAFLKVVPR